MQFLGYARADGSVGIRNHVAVLPGGLIAAKICDFVPGTKTIYTPNHGAGMSSRDRETVARLLIGLGSNPNVASVILHSTSPGAGYPELRPTRLAEEIAKTGKRVEIIKSFGLDAIQEGIKLAREMVREASKARREPFGLDNLTLGVKCGASDPTSGIAGNPAIGYLFDRVVEAGGVAMFGETTEIIGAEQALARRAVDDETAQKVLAAAKFVEERALAVGEDIRTINPVPANIAAGISTLEEKSLGAVHKAGHHPIAGALMYAEHPRGKGLFFVDNWMNHLSIFTGYAAAGAQLTLFQLGGGGIPERTLLDPSPAVVAPLLWATANPNTYERCRDGIDFFSGTIIAGEETIEEAGERLLALVADVASGTLLRGETIDYTEPSEIYRLDPVF
ncbi:MAG: UxaA family hydrolase [Chloroflexota bacterium]